MIEKQGCIKVSGNEWRVGTRAVSAATARAEYIHGRLTRRRTAESCYSVLRRSFDTLGVG